MSEIDSVLRNAGWLDSCESNNYQNMYQDFSDPFNSSIHQSVQWKFILSQKRNDIIQKRDEQAIHHTKINGHQHGMSHGIPPNTYVDAVRIVDQKYLTKSFKADHSKDKRLINFVVKEFSLNTEQERAFRIVANHHVNEYKDQLKMYLGGMAGTGKSQVIKALTHFFECKNASYVFMVLAPTGSAAALISGSTYHSILGINGYKPNESMSNLSDVRSRLKNVEYIFIDEVSMLDCSNMYNISSQMSLALQISSEPFGGKNMIFAGDFAQLPPPGHSPSLYSQTIGSVLHTTHSHNIQKWTIGKSLWHQVTVVVILRQNMRQKLQTAGDAKFRKALENMRYKSCTDADIQLIRSRIAGRAPEKPKLADERFRHVSIITALNAHRDKINELAAIRFASDINMPLVTFYSIDKWKTQDNDNDKQKGFKRIIDPL